MEIVFFILVIGFTWIFACRGRRCPVSATPSNAPHCLIPSTTRKNHKETFLLSYFCMTKRRVQGGRATSERRRRDGVYQKSHKVVPALCILPASSRLTLFKQPSPSGANIASEPSNRSIAIATGSKRLSADSDLLLCHVMLRRTSRVEVWVQDWCEHSEIGLFLQYTYSNTSSVAVNRATFLAVARSRSGSDSPRGCHSFPSRRFATHWRRLAKC